MAHQHTHDHHSTPDNLKAAFFLNLSFTLLEIVGGLLTNSVAIVADALHDLGDSVSLGLSWYLGKYAEREGDQAYSYGYRRFSLLGALVNTIILIVGGIFILNETIPRLLAPQPTRAPGMIVLALIGVAVNGFAALRLRGEETLNSKVVSWHLLEDALGWVAVLVVGVVLLFTDLHILDPILSVLITLYVLYNVIGYLRKTVRLFLQAVPEGIDIAELEDQFVAIDGVLSSHHTHIWSLDGEHHVLTTHLTVGSDANKELICLVKQSVMDMLHDYHFEHLTIEVEYEDGPCSVV